MNVQVVLGKSIPQMTEKKELLELLVAHKKTGWMMMQMMPSKLTEPKKRGDIIYRNKQEKQPNQLSSLDPVRYRLRLVFKLFLVVFLACSFADAAHPFSKEYVDLLQFKMTVFLLPLLFARQVKKKVITFNRGHTKNAAFLLDNLITSSWDRTLCFWEPNTQ